MTVPSMVRAQVSKTFRSYWQGESLRSRFVRSTVWSVVGTAAAQGSTFGAAIITARILGKSTYGEFGMVQSTVGTFGILAGLGLGLTSTKFIAEFRKTDLDRVGRIIGLNFLVAIASGLAGAGFLWSLAPYLASHNLNAPYLAHVLRISCLLLVFNAWAGVQQGVLAGFEAFRAIAKINTVRGIAMFPSSIVMALLWGLDGALWALTANGALGCVLAISELRKQNREHSIRIDWSSCWQEASILWRFSLPAVVTSSLVGPITWVANTIIVNRPNGYAEMGALTAANQFRLCLVALPTLIQSAVLPILSSEQREAQLTPDYHRAIDLTQVTSMIAVLPIGTVLILLGQQVMTFFGASFSGSYPVLLGLLVGSLLSMVGGAVGAAITARGQMWLGAMFNAVWGGVLLVTTWFLAPNFGATAYAIAFALAHVVLAVGGLSILRRELSKRVITRVFATIGYLAILSVICISFGNVGRVTMLICMSLLTACALPHWRRFLPFPPLNVQAAEIDQLAVEQR